MLQFYTHTNNPREMISRYMFSKKCVKYDTDKIKLKINWYICCKSFVSLLDDKNNVKSKFFVIL